MNGLMMLEVKIREIYEVSKDVKLMGIGVIGRGSQGIVHECQELMKAPLHEANEIAQFLEE
jgi:hypothetical protein